MAIGGDTAKHGMGCIQMQGRLALGRIRHAGQQPAREAPGQRHLANAGRAGDQPGVVQPAGTRCLRHGRGGAFMAKKFRIGARFRQAHSLAPSLWRKVSMMEA